MSRESENPYSSPESTRTPFPWSLVAATTSMILTGSATLFLIVLLGPLAWILRDGLGPSSTESSGLQAFERMFWTFYWGPLTTGWALTFLGSMLWRKRIM